MATTPTADAYDLARLRTMTAYEKAQVAHGLWLEARCVLQAVVGRQHPEWSDAQRAAEVRRRLSGA